MKSLALLTIVWLVLVTGGLAQETQVGKIIDIDGQVLKTNRMTESRWYQAYLGMTTYLSERLKSDSQTSATLEFHIGGRVVISPDTELEITTTESARIVDLKSGTMWAKFDKQDEPLQIKTAGGVLGIEGTEFLVQAAPDGDTTLTVVEGKVRIKSGQDEKVVTDGEEATFRRGLRRFRRFSSRNGLTISEMRQSAFRSLRIEGKPYAKYILSRGLSPRKEKRLLRRLFYTQAALRSPPRQPPALSSRRLVRPTQNSRSKFQVVSEVRPDGVLKATWAPALVGSYALFISSDVEGEDIVWHGKVEEPSFTYPAHGPALETDKTYYLSVTPLRPDGQPFQDRRGEFITDQTTFKATGHEPVYSEMEEVSVEFSQQHPKFSWAELNAAGGYLIKLVRDDALVWVGESSEPTYSYPLTARSLEPGTYSVQVEGFDPSGFKIAESTPTTFTTQGWEATGLEGPPRE